ncbi:MAG: hypothetical protein Q8M29_17815 [Bacteroidota bacterium]|nr:hypothetical protein [Bacteroidota bacterium]
MKKIGKHNYEAFLLDHMEGNLDEEGTKALFSFFETYPELKPEFFDDIENISLEPEYVSFKGKNELKHIEEEREEKVISYIEGQLTGTEKAAFEKQLVADPLLQLQLSDYKKTILSVSDDVSFTAKNNLKRTLIPEESIIAYSENVLSPAEKTELGLQLKNDVVAVDLLNLYSKMKAQADTTIVFPGKDLLKRKPLIVYLNTHWKPLSLAASVVLLFGLFWMMKGSFVTVDDTKVGGSLAAGEESTYWKQVSTDTNVSSDTNDVITPSANSYYASKNTNIDPIKDPSIRNQKDKNNVVEQPIANNNTNHPIDSFKQQENPLAIINLNHDKIAANYYNEKEEEFPIAKSTSLTTRDYVTKKITEAAWGEDDEAVAPKNGKKKLKGFDVLALIGKGLKKLGNKKSDAKKIELEEGKGTEYVVTIGGVSLTRRTAN